MQHQKYLQVSTDEVHGSGTEEYFTESSPLAPNNPYAAGKAAADCMTRAYFRTYGLNVNITRSTNNYGPFQYREKFIPTVIYSALRDAPILFTVMGCRSETGSMLRIIAALWNLSSSEVKREGLQHRGGGRKDEFRTGGIYPAYSGQVAFTYKLCG